MRAIILSAGLGKRMLPLTLHTPKPLLQVAGDPLIVHHIRNLSLAGIHEIVINLGHLGEKIKATLGNGATFGVNLAYSFEDPILETAGGIKQALALDLLGQDPFIAVSSDLFTDFPFANLPMIPKGLIHMILTDNPPHHPKGDYALMGEKVVEKAPEPNGSLLNFAGIAVYRPELFEACPEGIYKLPQLFKTAFSSNSITGEYYRGIWYNIGTPEDLQAVNLLIETRKN